MSPIPIKYMVIDSGYRFNVIDTSYECRGEIVASSLNLDIAHMIAYHLNTKDGFQYPYYTNAD